MIARESSLVSDCWEKTCGSTNEMLYVLNSLHFLLHEIQMAKIGAPIKPYCKWGHERTPDNVRKNKTCLTCHRMRKKWWSSRKQRAQWHVLNPSMCYFLHDEQSILPIRLN